MTSISIDIRNPTCRRGILCRFACVLGLLLLCCGTVASVAAPTMTVEQGTLSGIETDGVAAFLGVRYALPPVGDLRWRPPQPIGAGHQQLDATQFGDDCTQGTSPWGKPFDIG